MAIAAPTAWNVRPDPRPEWEHPILARIGNTPLIELESISRGTGVRLFAKLEGANPGGSVKDRAARGIVAAALHGGLLSGRRLLDASSGNTGIAYAMLGAAMGFGVTIFLPATASPERKRILRAYGAEVIETDPVEGTDGAIVAARERARGAPDRYYYADQYSNPANPAAHETTTGPEILRQMQGLPIDVFVAGLGTSGTFTGVARFLARHSPSTRRISVEPDSPRHGLEGLKHLETAMVPRIFQPELVDERAAVATEEGREMTRRLAREEGVLVGLSAGAAAAAALLAARRLGAETAVCIFPDGGDRYLSEGFWDAA
jgi:cysteine synthase B